MAGSPSQPLGHFCGSSLQLCPIVKDNKQFSTMEMSKTSKYFILKTTLKHILPLFSKPTLPFGTRSSSGSCFSLPGCSSTRRLLRRVKDQQPAKTCSLGTKHGLNVGEGRKAIRRTGHSRDFSQLRPEFLQRSDQKPSWRRVEVPPVSSSCQALTKFKTSSQSYTKDSC